MHEVFDRFPTTNLDFIRTVTVTVTGRERAREREREGGRERERNMGSKKGGRPAAETAENEATKSSALALRWV